MEVLGIDVGGSGIKGAIVNTQTGELISERRRIATPRPAKPKPIAKVVKKWAKRFDFFLNNVTRIASPDYFIIGGGLSKKFDKFEKELSVDVPIEVAQLRNNAGIVGAALFCEEDKLSNIVV